MNTDRLELLAAVERECERKILAVSTPASVLEHCEGLEKRACELFDLAQRIRKELESWQKGVDGILLDWLACKVEQEILRHDWIKGSVGDDLAKIVRGEVDRNRESVLKKVEDGLARRVEGQLPIVTELVLRVAKKMLFG